MPLLGPDLLLGPDTLLGPGEGEGGESTRPEVGLLGEQLYAALKPLNEPDPFWELLLFCGAWTRPLEPIYDLLRERDGLAPWAILLDPDECPAVSLPYLAQWVGVTLTPEMTEAQQRNEIRHPTGWKRGQTESIRIAVQRTLESDESLVIIHPRTPEVGRTYVRTLLSETSNPARTKAVIRAALPPWTVLDYEAIAGVTVEDVAASTNWITVEDLANAFPTVKALAEISPDEI